MCGEHATNDRFASRIPGSSPHVRGAQFNTPVGLTEGGIIPACAGSTAGVAVVPWAERGSSPHVRGAPWCVRVRGDGVGIIPACAGSTHAPIRFVRRDWDHPRMCGEHVHSARLVTSAVGSSPHVRGALRRRNSNRPPDRDHPRMCGEHRKSASAGMGGTGSSPHVRGALELVKNAYSMRGIIPACAGSTAGTAP